MIRYDLQCARGHGFDGWFRDSKAFDAQAKKGVIACPACGSTQVVKQLMTPGIPAKSNSKPDPRVAELMAHMREMRRKVEAEADYVGGRFAEEARRIHYGETEDRQIRGKTTPDEAEALREEGIEFFSVGVPDGVDGPVQ